MSKHKIPILSIISDEALKKRDELKKLFEKDDKNINPL